MPPPFKPFGPPPFPPKPFKKKPKPVNPRPADGKDYVAETELWCRSISPDLLDSYIKKLRHQIEIAERIRTERQVAVARFRQMTLEELEAVVAAGKKGWELGVAQQVLNERKPKPPGTKKTMPPKPPRRTPPPRPAGPGNQWQGKPG